MQWGKVTHFSSVGIPVTRSLNPAPHFPRLHHRGEAFQDSRESGPRLLPFRVKAAQSSLHSVCSSGSKAPKPSSAFLLHFTFSWPLSYTYVAAAENGSEKKPWSQDPPVIPLGIPALESQYTHVYFEKSLLSCQLLKARTSEHPDAN